MNGAVMVMMIAEITQMNRAAPHSSVQNVNSDVWMAVVLLEAGAVMGWTTVEMDLMKQNAVSASTYKFWINVIWETAHLPLPKPHFG